MTAVPRHAAAPAPVRGGVSSRPVKPRRTKILATVGPACADPPMLARLGEAGMDGARINLSHGTSEQWLATARDVRALEADLERPIAVLADLRGPKIRLAADTPIRRLAAGDELLLVAGATTPAGTVAVEWDDVCAAALPGVSEVVIGDGTPRMSVVAETTHAGEPALLVRCTKPGEIAPRRGATVTHVSRSAPSLTDKDRADLDLMVQMQPDFVALSFVRAADDIVGLRRELAVRGLGAVRIVAKIEKSEAMQSLDEIIAVSDAVMVARGDLGIELGVARVPLAQKDIIRRATRAGKLAITATQMLESMHLRPEPTRAEAADVANAILDGTSALMLSGETAQGSYPVESVRAMADIARVAEQEVRPPDLAGVELTDAEAVLQAAAVLGDGRGCACYVTPTQTGGSPRALARQRPRAPIVALCHDRVAVRQLALEWGVVSRWYAPPDSISALVDDALAISVELLALPAGAPVVITHGQNIAAPESTSLIVLRHVPDGLVDGETIRPPT